MADPILSIDLDSTLADTRHRKGVIEQFTNAGLPIDWTVYAQACGDDPLTTFGRLMQVLQDYVPWVVVSGRSEGAREGTMAWLKANDLRPESVYLEGGQTDLHTSMGHSAWKAQRIAEVITMHPSIRAHVDDWPALSALLEEHGVIGVTVLPPGWLSVDPLKNKVSPIDTLLADNPL